MTVQVLIIGGGLSGLHTAFELERKGLDYLLIEGRDRLGGRILSRRLDGYGAEVDPCGFDLGPAWFWPGQERMAGLVQELGLGAEVFAQFADGDTLLEADPTTVKRGDFGASMAGSYRLRGGMGSLIERLADHVPDHKVRLATRAAGLELRGDYIRTTVSREPTRGNAGAESIDSRSVVLALPPRLAEATLDFNPRLPDERRAELRGMATWMAGQGKFVALYDRPFWRHDGLSGDAFSYVGPLSEIHDASPDSGAPYGLFGFFGVPAAVRKDKEEPLKRACLAQMQRLFGPAAGDPLQTFTKDWAFDGLTATPHDLHGPAEHSLVGLTRPVEHGWGDRLLWSGSETARPDQRNNGYLEGALEAGLRTVEQLVGNSA